MFSQRQFVSIQVLRGFAALGVVLLHVVQMLEQYTAGDGPLCRLGVLLHTGAAGVDLFFVISGFVMVQSTKHLFQRPGSSKRFLIRRAIRIVPMYWIATLMMLVLVLLPFTLKGEHFSLGYTLRSLLFIPTSNPASGADLPLLPQGWTLWYEVYFYLIFAVSLRLPARWALPALVLFLTASSVVGAVLTPTHPLLRVVTSQLLLEFSLGCLLAYQVNRIRLSSRVAFVTISSRHSFVVGSLID